MTTDEIIDGLIEKSIRPMGSSPWYYIIGGVWVRTRSGFIKAGGELVKKRKPCLKGDYVHLDCWEGCYRVLDADVNGFTVMRNRNRTLLSWDRFRCLKGRGQSKEKITKVMIVFKVKRR